MESAANDDDDEEGPSSPLLFRSSRRQGNSIFAIPASHTSPPTKRNVSAQRRRLFRARPLPSRLERSSSFITGVRSTGCRRTIGKFVGSLASERSRVLGRRSDVPGIRSGLHVRRAARCPHRVINDRTRSPMHSARFPPPRKSPTHGELSIFRGKTIQSSRLLRDVRNKDVRDNATTDALIDRCIAVWLQSRSSRSTRNSLRTT